MGSQKEIKKVWVSGADPQYRSKRLAHLLMLTKVNENGCILYTGGLNEKGYATATVAGKTVKVHRFVYEMKIGPIPDGHEIDHIPLCRNRACINDQHLEAVTRLENMKRARPFRIQLTHCKNGHAFTKENTRLDARGVRICRECHKLWRALRKNKEQTISA